MNKSEQLVNILMNVYKDTNKVIEVLFNCFEKLKIFKPLALQIKNIQPKMSIPGLYYFPNVIDPELADDITEFLNDQDWKGVSTSETGRKVQQYGYEYDYSTRKGSDYKKINPIPELLLLLQQMGLKTIGELMDEETLNLCTLNQCIVNKYEPKQGISAHIDKESFGPVIVCFTLGSGTTMTFTTIKNNEKIVFEKYVEPNSVYLMTGESRYKWKHEIKSRVSDETKNGKIRRGTRISVTFRTVSE
jgi:alkylated DNA repair dioxygenase AlkB